MSVDAYTPFAQEQNAYQEQQQLMKNYAATMSMWQHWPPFDYNSMLSLAQYPNGTSSGNSSPLAAAQASPHLNQSNGSNTSTQSAPSAYANNSSRWPETPKATGAAQHAPLKQTPVHQVPQSDTCNNTPDMFTSPENRWPLAAANSLFQATPGTSSLMTQPGHQHKKKATPVPAHMKDETYWERRRRNNESARRSREARRQKEDGIAMKAVVLERENLRFRHETSMLRAQVEQLQVLLQELQRENEQLKQMKPEH